MKTLTLVVRSRAAAPGRLLLQAEDEGGCTGAATGKGSPALRAQTGGSLEEDGSSKPEDEAQGGEEEDGEEEEEEFRISLGGGPGHQGGTCGKR
eukprot:scaffold6474_cov139-Isochrysis_galbana.AAC.4